uniref:NADH-ubiquinone oxidoreductase chain 3 n=1 Tax=Ampithoe lacertosa TaxID=429030 RepID=A0A5P9W7W5_9CRUS|nr:NADH dehydrogenase subunit 3 [Ampithoe lacertosa]QFX74901.1 NADH dehydrogenase subunit 3 [Ampithoe lacertosa]
MLILMSSMIMSLLMSIILMTLAIMLSEKSNKEREKMTPFECGFSPFKKARSPFSIRFFLTTLIFLIFDIEIALLLPLGILTKISSTLNLMISSLIITVILLSGLLHEWKQGVLTWV